jgi:uncharacterized membrane protein
LTGANLTYLIFLVLPLIWGLSPRYFTSLIPAIPALTLNLLADYQPQKDLVHQYSLPILPFLLLTVIASLSAGKGGLRNPRRIKQKPVFWAKLRRFRGCYRTRKRVSLPIGIIVWIIVAFLAFGKSGYFAGKYLDSLDTLAPTREAIALVKTEGGVLTNSAIAPHLTHRVLVKLASDGSQSLDLNQFDYVLLNKRHPGWQSSPELITDFLERLKKNPKFNLNYEKEDVFLFKKSDLV